jgi:hypothetical protein
MKRSALPHKPAISDRPNATASPEYIFKIAESGGERHRAFELLYNEYLRAGYVSQNPERTLCTDHHHLPETTIFLAKSGASVLATASTIRDSSLLGLPMDSVFKDELDELRTQNRELLEISSLASDRSQFSRNGIRHFITLVYAHSLFQNVHDVCIMVNPRHVRLYESLFGFEIFGSERYYPRVNAPAVAMRVNVLVARKHFTMNGLKNTLPENFANHYERRGISICNRIRCTLESGNLSGRNTRTVKEQPFRDFKPKIDNLSSHTLQCRNPNTTCCPDLFHIRN